MRQSVPLAAVCMVGSVLANTEKTIFRAPAAANIPRAHPTLETLQIDTLTPESWTLRTHLGAEFPSESSRFGKSTWLILDQLTERQRYEVRVCWAATVRTPRRTTC